jgi:hypothetical protein
MELRRHLVPPQKMPRMPRFRARSFGQRLEQLRRDEHAADVVVRLEQRERLIDDMALVRLDLIHLRGLDEFDHPRGSRSTQNEMPPRAARDARRRAQPRGRTVPPSASRCPSESARRQRVAERLVVERKSSMLIRDFGTPVDPPVSNV